jgi:RNA polymerase sigma factor (TIGR02999 family)
VEITRLLQQLEQGDREALNLIIPLVYEELKRLARSHLRRERSPSALQTTGLVHEAFLKLAGSHHPSYENRSHFFGIASRAMRQILVDAARARAAEKRSAAREIPLGDLPDWGPPLNQELLVMEDALRRLESADSLKGRLIEMRFFGGMTAEECSTALSIPVHIVRRHLRQAQAWLHREMTARPVRPLQTPQAETTLCVAAA